MLIEFRLENHRSIAEEQALTMVATGRSAPADLRPRKVSGVSTPLLPVAAIYGANASGKSNLLLGMELMRDAVRDSHRSWLPEGGVPRDPFAWGPRRSDPTLVEVTFVSDSVRYRYGFVADDERFLEEWLYAWPRGREQMWFEREGDTFRFGEHLRGENRLIEQVTRPNALFLSAAVQHRHVQLSAVYSWFARLQMVGMKRRRAGLLHAEMWLSRQLRQRDNIQASLFDEAVDVPETSDRLQAFRNWLREADVGISDVKVSKDEVSRMGPRRRIYLQHGKGNEDAWLPLEEESQGTVTLVLLAPKVIDALSQGGVVIIDELEASLHPLLGLQIVRHFNSPETNPRNAQLLFTTHDTNLLGTMYGPTPLRRDQVWLAEKNEEGTSRIFPLTDYSPRAEENLERGYLQGRYGAIPFLPNLLDLDG